MEDKDNLKIVLNEIIGCLSILEMPDEHLGEKRIFLIKPHLTNAKELLESFLVNYKE